MYPEPIVLQFGGGKEMKSWIDLFHQAKKRANMNQGDSLCNSNTPHDTRVIEGFREINGVYVLLYGPSYQNVG